MHLSKLQVVLGPDLTLLNFYKLVLKKQVFFAFCCAVLLIHIITLERLPGENRLLLVSAASPSVFLKLMLEKLRCNYSFQ